MFDRRTKICVVLIMIGLANFLAYAIGYSIINGEAIHGMIVVEEGVKVYYLAGRPDAPVSRATFIYSAVHSISIWVSFAMVMLSMLTLAKDRIASSMRSALLRGRAIITTIAIIVAIVSILLTYMFVHRFAEHLRGNYKPAVKAIEKQ